jgi:hypothetical protein
MARKTTRLYYGLHPETGKPLYWTLKVKNAKKRIAIDGTIEHAMRGKPGLSIGCHLSNVAKANKSLFPHPALYISFTQSVCLVVTKITNGSPSECVRYRHAYGHYVNLNDTNPSKRIIKANPELFKREFILQPYKHYPFHWKEEYGRRETGARTHKMARGELARMRAAGLVLQELS